jgi:hypothetical protein
VFELGIPLMAVTFVLVALIPQVPLRSGVRDDVQAPDAAGHEPSETEAELVA